MAGNQIVIMDLQILKQTEKSLKDFQNLNLFEASIQLFEKLGYNTKRQNQLEKNDYKSFSDSFIDENDSFDERKAIIKEWKSIDLLFQLTETEFSNQGNIFDTGKVDNTIIETNGKEIQVFKLGDVGAAPHGISTGNNKKYIRIKANSKTSYEIIKDWMICPKSEIENLSEDEKIMGLNKEWTLLKGCFIPFEKGGRSNSDDGWLPNYYVPTQYYINWAKGAILDMRKNAGVAWKNERYFFKNGLTFSISGIYAPTFRLNSGGVFEAKGSGLFCEIFDDETLLGFMGSKLAKFILKNFIKHSVDTSGDDIASFNLVNIEKKIIEKITSKVLSIIKKQKSNLSYDYSSHEQIEIDCLVYSAYGLNKQDIQEVENWYARRYPKLVKAQRANLARIQTQKSDANA